MTDYNFIRICENGKDVPLKELKNKPVEALFDYTIMIAQMPVVFNYDFHSGMHYARNGRIITGPFTTDAHNTLIDIATGAHARKHRRRA